MKTETPIDRAINAEARKVARIYVKFTEKRIDAQAKATKALEAKLNAIDIDERKAVDEKIALVSLDMRSLVLDRAREIAEAPAGEMSEPSDGSEDLRV
jgi:hypothetical protein